MGMCNYVSATFFTILTIATTGLTAAAVAALLVLIKVKDIDIISQQIFIGMVIALVVILLIFAFAIYASCCGKRCAKAILGVVFFVYVVALIALAVIMFTKRNDILEEARRFWVDAEKLGDTYQILEKAFNCTCWTIVPNMCAPEETWLPGEKVCRDVMKEGLDMSWKVVAGVAIGFAALNLIGMICAFVFACCVSEKERRQSITYEPYEP